MYTVFNLTCTHSFGTHNAQEHGHAGKPKPTYVDV